MTVPVRLAALAIGLVAAGSMPAGAGSHLTMNADGATAPSPTATVLPALSPVAAAVQAALAQAYPPSAPERRFYEARGFAPVWTGPDGAPQPATSALLAWAGQADAHGLPPARYNVAGVAASIHGSGAVTPERAAQRELALTRLFVTFARDIGSGLLEPGLVDRNIDIEPRRPAPDALLAGIARAGDPAAYLDRLIPESPEYRNIVKLYASLRASAAAGDWHPVIADGPTLRLGDSGPRVAQLRARLGALGDLPEEPQDTAASGTAVAANDVVTDATPAPGKAASFDPFLEAAVRQFQERHGLNPDGVVGPATLAALNTSAAERAAQTAVNLERLRWLNYDLGRRHVVINIADFSMSMIEDGQLRFRTRTVVGQSRRHQTPEFVNQLEFIVVNPVWNVPFSIATEEILPQLRENPLYLQENNMTLVGSDLPADQIDWTTVTRASFPGRIRQRPGADNALGTVKFLFPNRHSIYMHDTPSRKLFARDRRDFSHGCVRLADPREFALLLLSLQGGVDDPEARFEALRARPGEQWVKLDDPFPVYLTYRTAWVDELGQPQFRADIYGRDRTIAAALNAAGVAIAR